jgi:hypothetical protein
VSDIIVTRRDVEDAITLCNVMASNEDGVMWCSGSRPKRFGTAPCGHLDFWRCAADAIGASETSVDLMIRSGNAVMDAWSSMWGRADEAIEIVAPRHVTILDNNDLEAECLLREGWLPSGFALKDGTP